MTAGTAPRLLDKALLKVFEERLRRAGAPIAEAFLPGLTDDRIQAHVAPLGQRLPREARTWWGWHNGAGPSAEGTAAEIGPGRRFFSLDAAVTACQRIRTAIWAAEPPIHERAAQGWSPAWLPLVESQPVVALDTSGDDDDPVPVRAYDPESVEHPVHSPSLGELITLWIEAMDRGDWAYDQAGKRWISRKSQRPPEGSDLYLRARKVGLV